jgi:hypothetical protein
MTRFEWWWYNVGSGIRPLQGEDTETFAKRVSRLAVEAVIPNIAEINEKFPKLDPTNSYQNSKNRNARVGAKWMRKILMGR